MFVFRSYCCSCCCSCCSCFRCVCCATFVAVFSNSICLRIFVHQQVHEEWSFILLTLVSVVRKINEIQVQLKLKRRDEGGCVSLVRLREYECECVCREWGMKVVCFVAECDSRNEATEQEREREGGLREGDCELWRVKSDKERRKEREEKK